VAVRERSLPDATRPAPVHRPLAGSVVLHALLLVAALLLASDHTLPLAEEPEAVALVFQPPAPQATPAATPVPPAPQPPVEPQPPPSPAPAPQPPAPAPRPPVPEAPPPPPEEHQPSLPLPPPPAPPPPPEPAQRSPPPRPTVRPTPSNGPLRSPSTPAANPAPPTAAAASAKQSVSPNWQGALAAWLEAHKTYPQQARRRGEQGRGSVRFTVDHSGQVLDVAIVSSTGSAILDDAIERMLRGAHVPPLPASMDETQITVTVQIRYALE
jgi:protein TonB